MVLRRDLKMANDLKVGRGRVPDGWGNPGKRELPNLERRKGYGQGRGEEWGRGVSEQELR